SIGSVQNVANVTSSTTDTSTSNNTSGNVQSLPTRRSYDLTDLTLSKSGPSSVQKGSNVVYTLTVNNTGPASASNVVVTDAIPSGLTFIAGSSDSSCVQQSNNIVCTIGTMTSGQSRNLTLTF